MITQRESELCATLMSLFRDFIGFNDPASGKMREFRQQFDEARRTAAIRQAEHPVEKPAGKKVPYDRQRIMVTLMRNALLQTCRNPAHCKTCNGRRTGRCRALEHLDRMYSELKALRAARAETENSVPHGQDSRSADSAHQNTAKLPAGQGRRRSTKEGR